MGMNFNFSNFGSLFGGGSSSSGGLAGLLGDYASIKNGSYGRLMKAYYKEAAKDTVKGSGSSSKTSKKSKSIAEDIIAEKMKSQQKVETAESKAYTQVKSATNALDQAADKLLKEGVNSVFEKKGITTTDENGLEMIEFGYDKTAIYNAVEDFVKDYNSVVKAAGGVSNTSISNRVTNMEKDTYTNRDALNRLGITIKADNTLSIDKDAFMKADMGVAKSLFNDGAYTRGVKESAYMINQNANYEQLRANTYTYDGTYNSAYKSGSSFNSTL